MEELLWEGVAMSTAASLGFAWAMIRKKNMQHWLPNYYAGRVRRRLQRYRGHRHVLFCFVDHFEPEWRHPSLDTARARVQAWRERYPETVKGFVDADGRPPVHSFFFPQEEYRPEYIDGLVALCRQGLGEVEIHLHHDNDTAEGLRQKLELFKQQLVAHDCLPVDASGRVRYAFIHGNWCLDNARPDGRWCGVNNEIEVLANTGCYADFTLPAAPNASQTAQVNSIYYAVENPSKPRSHDNGPVARVGRSQLGDLMLIQGPLALNWRQRSGLVFPRIENGDVCAKHPPSPTRTSLWVEQGIGVRGRPEWVFVKVHTHGAGEDEARVLLGEPMRTMLADLQARYNDGQHYSLHYVSAREMYNIARAAEDGCAGNPNDYRDYEILRPAYGIKRATERLAGAGG